MSSYEQTGPAFLKMAHHIVWCAAATVDSAGRPRTRILHPIWQWDGATLVGWIATSPTPTKRAHLEQSPNISLNYWAPNHDTCSAECRAEWVEDDAGCVRVWDLFKNGPEPVGYDPAMIPPWKDGPLSSAFMALRVDPWRLRVFPGSVLMGKEGEVLTWSS
ncbi:MAG TPA: pyridoxamine 5'-phosphate oxidase family protein [Acidimicrobiales bacterium]|nr:pyridoxamine 5'-phosphate oxidase family protein [Acidimicrobiales bacterium]